MVEHCAYVPPNSSPVAKPSSRRPLAMRQLRRPTAWVVQQKTRSSPADTLRTVGDGALFSGAAEHRAHRLRTWLLCSPDDCSPRDIFIRLSHQLDVSEVSLGLATANSGHLRSDATLPHRCVKTTNTSGIRDQSRHGTAVARKRRRCRPRPTAKTKGLQADHL